MRSRASARVQPIPVRSPLGFRGIGGLYRLAAMLVVLAMVSGCGRFTFFNGFAEAAIAREVDYHLNLDQEEKVQVEKKIEELLEWHSATMLPRYATYLNAQAAVIERGPPSRAAVTAMITGLRGLLDELVAGAAPFTADILVDHTEPARVRYLQQRMRERLEERREEEAEKSHDERLEERTKRITSNFENLAGDMNEAQLQIVSRYAATTNRDSAKWLHTRGQPAARLHRLPVPTSGRGGNQRIHLPHSASASGNCRSGIQSGIRRALVAFRSLSLSDD